MRLPVEGHPLGIVAAGVLRARAGDCVEALVWGLEGGGALAGEVDGDGGGGAGGGGVLVWCGMGVGVRVGLPGEDGGGADVVVVEGGEGGSDGVCGGGGGMVGVRCGGGMVVRWCWGVVWCRWGGVDRVWWGVVRLVEGGGAVGLVVGIGGVHCWR